MKLTSVYSEVCKMLNMQVPDYITIIRNFDLFGADPQTKYHTSDCNCFKFSADSLGNDTLEDIKGEII